MVKLALFARRHTHSDVTAFLSPWVRERLGAVSVLLVVSMVSVACTTPSGRWLEGQTRNGWRLIYDGYGAVTCGGSGPGAGITLRPRSPRGPGETHAALLASIPIFNDVAVSANVRTESQLRRPRANPWEVGWLLWHYQDNQHFYAFALKTNGWELTKQDPEYRGGQRFLVTADEPRISLSTWHSVTAVTNGPHVSISVDGRTVTTFTDRQDPYLRGRVALYTEDAVVTFQRVVARAIE